VGTTTQDRLRAAGYDGYIASRQEKYEEVILDFLAKEAGFGELREVIR
jgi:hypothetical protein